MEINLKENIYFKAFNNKVELNTLIVEFIFSNNIDKVIYKGDPNEINYKLLKKVIPLNETNSQPELVRKKYKNILKLFNNQKYCVIYRK